MLDPRALLPRLKRPYAGSGSATRWRRHAGGPLIDRPSFEAMQAASTGRRPKAAW